MPKNQHVTSDSTKQLEPLTVDGIRAVQIGTIIWAAAFIISLPLDNWLHTNGIEHAPAICAAGVALGLLGQMYTKRRAKRIKAGQSH